MHLCNLLIEDIPASGTAMIDINLSSYLNNINDFDPELYTFHAVDILGDDVHTCFVPDEALSFPSACSGKFVFFNLKSEQESLAISLKARPSYKELANCRLPFGGGFVEFSDDFLPNQVTLRSGETIALKFADKLKRNLINSTWAYDEENIGEFPLVHTTKKLIIQEDKLTVIRNYGEYIGSNGNPHSGVTAYYDVFLFAELSLIYICTNVNTNYCDMHAIHFMELELSRDKYAVWKGGYPLQGGEINSSSEGTISLDHWTALSSDTHTLAYLSSGLCALTFEDTALRLNAHFDLARNGAYLQNNSDETLDGWLTIMDQCENYNTVQNIYHTLPDKARVSLIQPELTTTEKYHVLLSRDIMAHIKIQSDGLSLFSLKDLKSGKLLTPCDASPLFCITLQDLVSGETHRLCSAAGWSSVSAFSSNNVHTFKLAGAGILNCLSVTLTAKTGERDAIEWSISMTSCSKRWSLTHLSLAELPLVESWNKEAILYPKGAGSLLQNAWTCKPNLRNTYPSLFYCMQFLAAYGEYSKESGAASRGMYYGIHDTQGLRKDIHVDYQLKNKAIHLHFVQQVPVTGEALCHFESCTDVVWQLFDGDWYDAAMIYKKWALTSSDWAKRQPLVQKTGGWLENTAVWLYANVLPENPVWQKSSVQALDCNLPSWKEGIKKVSKLLGLPIAVHTYKWHQIPFDNDYPHYFPAREGFAEDVKELQGLGIKIMPYINARLWDTRDKENTDYQYSSKALAGTAKDTRGRPWRECYSSREQDGSLVVLGVMCPSSDVWKQTLKAIIQRLYVEIGVDAVYMDQIAAAPPVPCYDHTHSHLPGAGSWWSEKYYQLIRELRQGLPDHAVLTTECNSDPYMNQFDGYLTWQWEYPDSVPLFPVVYSGKMRTFGRNYKRLDDPVATCMLAAQQLVYGDQIGWFEASIADKPYFPVISDMIRLRWLVREYMSTAEMCRPIQLDCVPEIQTDFGWSAKKVCLPAVQTGVWKAGDGNSILLLFANGSEIDVSVTLNLCAEAYGLTAAQIEGELITPTGEISKFIVKNKFTKDLTIKIQSSFAIKLTTNIN